MHSLGIVPQRLLREPFRELHSASTWPPFRRLAARNRNRSVRNAGRTPARVPQRPEWRTLWLRRADAIKALRGIGRASVGKSKLAGTGGRCGSRPQVRPQAEGQRGGGGGK